MKKLIYILLVIVSFYSCEQYPEPGYQTIESFNFYIIGNQQSSEAGDYLTNEIGVQINLESLVPKTDKKFHMVLEIISGNGTVDKSIVEADNEGRMLTRWKLGDDINHQVIKGKIYDSSDRFYSEFEIQATAFFLDKWNTISTGYLVGIQDMVRDTVAQRSMLISGRYLYVFKNKFYDWEKISLPYKINLNDLEINSKGEVFGGGWDGNLYKTTDWGQSWVLISRPIPDNIYSFELSISKDDFIWVSRWDLDMYCSTDGGYNWQKNNSSTESRKMLGPVYQLNDTSHVALAQNVMQTFDNGINWKALNTPLYPLTFFVTDENEIIVQNQDGGFTLHKSPDSGETYKKIFDPPIAFRTSSWNCYDKFKNYYYVLAPAGGVWKTKDFETFEELITFTVQSNLFIDHQGTIYAGGFNYVNADPEPTLILPAGN